MQKCNKIKQSRQSISGHQLVQEPGGQKVTD